MIEKRTILVTGAAGFLGGAVTRLLQERGTPTLPVDRVADNGDLAGFELCDVTDIHRLHSLAARNDIGGIVHCGAFSGPMLALDNPHAMVQVNIVGTANVLELARIHDVPRFVFCSSASAYGATEGSPVPEDVALHPTSVYGASKAACEQLVATYAWQYGVNGVSLRLAWVYGPHRSTDCIIRTMLQDALNRCPTRIPYGRDFFRQFVHIDDAARALVTALDKPDLKRRIYTVTGGTRITLGDLAEIVRKVLPQADIQLDSGPDPLDDLQHQFDISAALRDLDLAPLVTLEDGIRHYAGWLATRRAAA